MNGSYLKFATRFLLILAIAVLVAPRAAHAQINSNTASVSVTATFLESITLTATPSALTLNLAPGGISSGSLPVAITTTWVLGATRSQLNVYGSFSSPGAALTDGMGDNIPSANILGQVSTGVPIAASPFSQSSPFAGSGASLKLVAQAISPGNLVGNRTDNLVLSINMTSGPVVPPGTYVGTLTIQAQAL
jgi:hypothetical protein